MVDSEEECERLAQTQSSIAFCPTSNLFLGSGLLNLNLIEKYKINIGLATDVGAGTSFSQLKSLADAYKIMQLQNINLDPFKSLYLATLGSAKALSLDDKIGNFSIGKEADFIILDYNAFPLISRRIKETSSIKEKLFSLFTLGDDRLIKETYSNGNLV